MSCSDFPVELVTGSFSKDVGETELEAALARLESDEFADFADADGNG
jgi:hypothetical protein